MSVLLAALLLTARASGAESSALSPSLTADLDGDGRPETVLTAGKRGSVRVQILDENGRKAADGRAPSPEADVYSVALTSAPLGSAGSLVEVTASTDALVCRSVWRYRDRTLSRLPIRDPSGRPLPDCEAAGRSTARWERETEDRPAVYVRERVEKAERGTLRKRDVYAFAGFSLDFDPKLSSSDVGGVPIPPWYRSILYTRAALERLYSRFGLTALQREPTLRIETDPERGVFALRFAEPSGEIVLPVDTYALTEGTTVTLGARDGTHQARATVRLGGDGSVPVEVRVEGLGSPLDAVYAPAGGWHGRARQVFPTAADEIAAEGLAGVWNDSRGRSVTIAVDGAPPYRLRVGSETFSLDMDRAAAPADLLLVAADASGGAWGVSLRGPNAFVRTPLACSGEAAARVCHPSGAAEMLRRVGARVNAQ